MSITVQMEQFEFDLSWKKFKGYDLLCILFIIIETFNDELKYFIQIKH